MNPTVYLVAPVEILSLYVGAYFKRTPTSDGLTIGTPRLEAEGVPNRRGLVAHPFTREQVEYARNVLKARGHDQLVTFMAEIPRDWRPMLPPGGGP